MSGPDPAQGVFAADVHSEAIVHQELHSLWALWRQELVEEIVHTTELTPRAGLHQSSHEDERLVATPFLASREVRTLNKDLLGMI